MGLCTMKPYQCLQEHLEKEAVRAGAGPKVRG